MKKQIFAAMLSAVLFLQAIPLTTVHAEEATASFSDVAASSYYAEAVEWAAQNKITSGIGDNKFGPDNTCTRGQIITFLYRFAGSEKTSSDYHFADVTDSAYYADAVNWAVENGITSGTSNTTFSPDQPCTRAQAVAFMNRMAGSPCLTTGEGFNDVGEKAYYYDAVTWAVHNGVTSGTGDGNFSPDAPCKRGQIVTFLLRYQENCVENEEIPADYLDTSRNWRAILATMDDFVSPVYDVDGSVREVTEAVPSCRDSNEFWFHIERYISIQETGSRYWCDQYQNWKISEKEIREISYAMYPDFDGKIPDIPSEYNVTPEKPYGITKKGLNYYISPGNIGEQPERAFYSTGSGTVNATSTMYNDYGAVTQIPERSKITFELAKNKNVETNSVRSPYYYTIQKISYEDATVYPGKTEDTKAYQKYLVENGVASKYCTLYDFNNDGQKELLVDDYSDDSAPMMHVYTYDGNAVKNVPIQDENGSENGISILYMAEMRPFAGGITYDGWDGNLYFVCALRWKDGKITSTIAGTTTIDIFKNSNEALRHAMYKTNQKVYAELGCGDALQFIPASQFVNSAV